MVEPVGATLGGISVFSTVFDSCRRLYHTYERTRSFGLDFEITQWDLEREWLKLDMLSRTPLISIGEDVAIHSNQTKSAVRRQLVISQNCFEECNSLLRRYVQKGEIYFSKFSAFEYRLIDRRGSNGFANCAGDALVG